MNTRYVTTISLMLAFCNCEQEYNITFHGGKKTWIDAVKYCNDNDGVIYNDKDDIQKRLNNISIHSEVWAGQYKALSPWTVTWGCHKIPAIKSNTKFSVPRINQTECQNLCSGTEFFAIKEDICVCLLPGNLQEKINYSSCSCNECYKVMRHKISNVRSSCNDDTKCLCMAAACIDRKIKLTSENCTYPFIVKCDDVITSNSIYKTHVEAVRFCTEKSSFLQWYKNDNCSVTMKTVQHWTSGTRVHYTYQVKRNDMPTLLPSFRCLKLTKSAKSEIYVACDNNGIVLPFYCKNENMQKDEVIKENDNTGVIAGSVAMVLLVVALSALGLFLYKRSIDSKAYQNKIRHLDKTTNECTTETNSDGPETRVRKGNRPLPKPLTGNVSLDDKPDEDENTYCRIASVFVDEPRSNFSNQNYNEMDFKGDTNTLQILHKENKQLDDNTEDDENFYSRIESAIFEEPKQNIANAGNNDLI
ncbi:unnamed protein product [Mytilus coruscus]|uniref:C-type lectin domain-containing protein n=1 Tax=Mytilus coruscus TaxID=42192 RepID=A0A6J8AP40_MYTCO|nr:unnamed protein product [Mytilus coruscus]